MRNIKIVFPVYKKCNFRVKNERNASLALRIKEIKFSEINENKRNAKITIHYLSRISIGSYNRISHQNIYK